ncbi:MAG: anaerobic ribonucleoside-triphosphate reductase, partial [Oscillospiraceae bacterium]
MITRIIKRDGREVEFDIEKVANAIFGAAQAIGGRDYQTSLDLANRVADYLEDNEITVPTVEQVQDAVEKVLIDFGHSRTAKEYILYRGERTRVREMKTKLMKIYEDLTFKSAMENDVKRENANIDGDTAMGTMLKYGSEGAKQFYEMFILDPEQSQAHKNGDIHIHDLDFLTLTTTCCQIDIQKLFKDGFCTGHGFLREPNDIQSYAALACIAIQSNQNDQHGGQSIPNFDYGMAPGVAKTYSKCYRDNMMKSLEILCGNDAREKYLANYNELKEKGIVPTIDNRNNYTEIEKEALKDAFSVNDIEKSQEFTLPHAKEEIERKTYQAMEALVHNLNTMHSRAGAQIPFSSINYGTDTSEEGRLVIKSVLLATDSGLGNGETPIFPIHIFKVKEGINYNKEDKNYDLFKLA